MIDIAEHDSLIRTFLKNGSVRKKLSNYLASKNEINLLGHLLSAEFSLLNPLRNIELSDAIEIDESILSEIIKPNFNGALNDFCCKYDIFPPIQLFFRTKKKNVVANFKGVGYSNVGAHFACSNCNKDHTSNKFIALDDLKSILTQAISQIAKKESFELSESSPFMSLQKRLEKKLKRYPCQSDFEEEGGYYRDGDLHNEVLKILQENNKCLVVGNPGSGKTSFVLAIGYDLLKLGHSVFYHDASIGANLNSWTSSIKPYAKEDVVIIDNIHLKPDEANTLLCSIGENAPTLLMTSRIVNPDLVLGEHPDHTMIIGYWDIFQEEKSIVKLNYNSDKARYVIKRHINSNSELEDKIGNVDSLLDKCEGDYNILQFYLQAWRRSGYATTLSAIEEKKILGFVYSCYLKQNPHLTNLLRLSALSQLEISVDSNWICEDTDPIQRDGTVQFISEEDSQSEEYVSFLRIYHPTIANLYLKAAAYKKTNGIRTVKEYTCECLKDYLEANCSNFFHVLWNVYIHENDYFEAIITPDLCQTICEMVQQKDARFKDADYLYMFIYIRHLAIKKAIDRKCIIEKLLEPLKQWYEQSSFVIHHVWYPYSILMIANILDIEISPFLSRVDFFDLGRRTGKDVSLLYLAMEFIGISDQKYISDEKVREFCEGLDFCLLGEISRDISNKDIKTFGVIISFIAAAFTAGVSKEKIVTFSNQLNYRKLGVFAGKAANVDVVQLISLLDQLGISDSKIAEFCTEVNFLEIEKIIKSNSFNWNQWSCLVYCFWETQSAKRIKRFMHSLDYQKLGETAAACTTQGLANAITFILLSHKIKNASGKIVSFCNALDFRKLGRMVNEFEENMPDVIAFIFLLFSTKGLAKRIAEFCCELDCHILGRKLRESEVELCWVISLIKILHANNVPAGKIADVCEELDFRKMGQEAKKYEKNILEFIDFTSILFEVGVEKSIIDDFCNNISFQKLAETVWKQGNLFAIGKFLEMSVYSKVFKKKILDFHTEKDFKKLAEQCKRTNQPQVNFLGLITTMYMIDLSKEKIVDFCEKWDFHILGQQAAKSDNSVLIRYKRSGEDNSWNYQKEVGARKGNIGVLSFVKIICEIGMSQQKIISFCKELDFYKLGQSIREENFTEEEKKDIIDTFRKSGITAGSIAILCKSLDG